MRIHWAPDSQRMQDDLDLVFFPSDKMNLRPDPIFGFMEWPTLGNQWIQLSHVMTHWRNFCPHSLMALGWVCWKPNTLCHKACCIQNTDGSIYLVSSLVFVYVAQIVFNYFVFASLLTDDPWVKNDCWKLTSIHPPKESALASTLPCSCHQHREKTARRMVDLYPQITMLSFHSCWIDAFGPAVENCH